MASDRAQQDDGDPEISEEWEETEDEGDERLPGDPADDHGGAAGAREQDEAQDEPELPRAIQHKAASPEYPAPPCTVVVGPGDCIASLAKRYRRLPDQIWNAPENAELKRTRKQNLLLPGDRVFIPDVVRKQVDGVVEKRHRFKVKTPTTSLKLRLLREEKPRANLDYVVEIGGKSYEGKTGADGTLEVTIPADAARGTLRLLDPAGEESYPLELGDLNPVEDVTGVQARLNNLGFATGAVDGEVGPRTRGAVAAFQRANGMRMTGEIDDALRSKLVERHGS